jgi:hypothetical protein
MLRWAIDVEKSSKQPRPTFDFKHGNYDGLNQELGIVNWASYLPGNTNEKRTKFTQILTRLQLFYIPKQKCIGTKCKKVIWLNRTAMEAVVKKQSSGSIRITPILQL